METVMEFAHRYTSQEKAAAELINAHNFLAVRARLLKEGVVPESHIDEAIAEYRNWLILAACNRETSLSMFSTYVDEVWHTHILFTRDYMALTTATCGAYLHHIPHTDGNQPTREESWAAAEKFKHAYKRLFGYMPPPIWGLHQGALQLKATCDGSPTCKTCNSYCTSPGPGCTSDG